MNSPRDLLASLRKHEHTSRAIDKAFEQAWLSIEGNYLAGLDSERARWKLASALLAVAPYHGTDVAKLGERALQRMRFREGARND
jgi:hypothetical protein